MSERAEFVRARSGAFRELKTMPACRAAAVPRSCYYAKRAEPSQAELQLVESIKSVKAEWRCYGYRRIATELGESEKTVRWAMQKHGLMLRLKRKKPQTTFASYVPPGSNLVAGWVPVRQGQVLGADVTCIPMGRRFAYLAVVLDIGTRELAGWAVSWQNNLLLAQSALILALAGADLPDGWIHHSDRGSPYTSAPYRAAVECYHGKMSFTDPASPRQNAFVESFIKTLKDDETNGKHYSSIEELQKALERYFDAYNNRRQHTSLGKMPFVQYKHSLLKEHYDQD